MDNTEKTSVPNLKNIKQKDADGKIRQVVIPNVILLISAVAGIFIYGVAAHRNHQAPGHTFITYATLLALASTAAGLFLGFLFGIPRTLTNKASLPATEQSASTSSAFGVNTNMEQISDWLTKIIVGVGLVEMHKIINLFDKFTSHIGSTLVPIIGKENSINGQLLAGSIIIFFLVEGFLAAYLWTRLYLAGIQSAVDMGDEITAQLKAQDDKDKVASALAAKQLNLPPGAADISPDELYSTFIGVSGSIINDIFIRAQDALSTCREDINKAVRTIAIFRTLIKLDTGNKFPQNHEQLAYALFKKTPPDYQGAEKELTDAISLYGTNPPATLGTMYFYRAVSRIYIYATDANGQIAKVPPIDKAKEIAADIDLASKDQHGAELIKSDATIKKWMTDILPKLPQ